MIILTKTEKMQTLLFPFDRMVRYSPSNGIIVNVILRDFDLHFQSQAFSCYVLTTKNSHAADVRGRFASNRMVPPWRCSSSVCRKSCLSARPRRKIKVVLDHQSASDAMQLNSTGR